MKYTVSILALCLLLSCCDKQNKSKPQQASFTRFEMSYTTGWVGSFTISVDSSRIYFIPGLTENYYGTVPDSIFSLINNSARSIKRDTSLKILGRSCIDCSDFCIKLIVEGDTIRIRQDGGHIKKMFWPMINSLQLFVDSAKHNSIKSGFLLHDFETYWTIHPMPSPAPGFYKHKKRSKRKD